MSKARINGGRLRETNTQDRSATISHSAADWLSLAAAPVLAIMALLTATQHGSTADILRSAGHGSSPLSGMTLIYVLMSVFHAAPWVRLVSRRWS